MPAESDPFDVRDTSLSVPYRASAAAVARQVDSTPAVTAMFRGLGAIFGSAGPSTAGAAIGVAEAGFALALYVILSFRTHRDDGGRRRR